MVNMSEQLRSHSIPLQPSKTIRLLKPGQAASMFVELRFSFHPKQTQGNGCRSARRWRA